MVSLDALSNPYVLFTVAAVAATTVLLTLAVVRSLQAPTKRQAFNDALDIIAQSELDIDTALNKSESKRKSWFEYWAWLAEESGAVLKDQSSPGRTAAGIGILGGVFGMLVFPGGPIGLVALPLVGLVAYRGWFMMERRKRVVAMEKQLPQLLSGLRANLQAGATPQQAIISVADDLPSPLGDELRILKRDLNVNVPLDAALKGLADRVPSREMQFLVASVEIAVRSGSDLAPLLETIQNLVAQRTRIRSKLRAAVAQVKPTQLLAYGAVPLMFFVSVRADANREYWFGKGLWVLIIAIVLYCAGGFAIRTMVKSVENT